MDYIVYRGGLEVLVFETKTGKHWTLAEFQRRQQLWQVKIQIPIPIARSMCRTPLKNRGHSWPL